MGRTSRLVVGTSLLLLLTPASAQVGERDPMRLGQDLTPVGAERAGNASGTIPEWTGGLSEAPADWKVGDSRTDPFAADAPLFTIDARNVDEYAENLSPGQIALIRRYDGYRMDVYPTRRSCAFPQWIYDATRRNAERARLDADQVYLESGWHPFLFPLPRNGAEAIWNHQFAFLSEGKVEFYAIVVPTRSGDMTPVREKFVYHGRMYDPSYESLEAAEGRVASAMLERLAPPRLAGQIFLVHEMVNEERRAWAYNPGQRRVRRAPTVAYDNPLAGTEGLMTNDQVRMFNGIIDRFDWKLVGKRELYVPYNTFRVNHSKDLRYREMLGPLYPRRDLIRYELHRVWVVEATLKQGRRHVFGKRVFYLDEDSWLALTEDLYDRKGNLWRVMEGMHVPIAEVPTCALDGTFSYDLVAERYVADRIKTEEPADDWLAGREGRVTETIFTPDALRRMGRR
jgi:hypothetical protein